MQIDIITIFPEMFTGPFQESILSRAQDKGLVKINIHDLRNWAEGVHKQVDDRPFGGGPGMVMMVEPIDKALTEIVIARENWVSKKILMSAKGQRFNQQKAQELVQIDQLILICGHYEGVDERVAKYLVDEEISIGDFVLTGGEIPAMAITDSVTRLIPGVLGDQTSIVDESHKEPGYLEYPHYTRPAIYKSWNVPDILLSGNHALIEQWRLQQSTKKTY